MSFKSWWDSLGQPGPLAKRYTENNEFNAALRGPVFHNKDHNERVIKQYDLNDRNELYRIIVNLLADRKVLTPVDFDNQLKNYSRAIRAQEALNLTKSDSVSMKEVVDQNVKEEQAKLKALIFEDLNTSSEAAEGIIRAYIQRLENEDEQLPRTAPSADPTSSVQG